MGTLKDVLLKDWRYKLIALVVAVSLWSVVNFGSRVPITVSKYVEVRNGKQGLVYNVKPDRVNVTVYVVERLTLSKMMERVRVYVDVSGVGEPGNYKLRVITETELPFLVQPRGADPTTVEVLVEEKPPR